MYDLLCIDWGKRKVGICLGSSELKIAIPKNILINNSDLEENIHHIISEKNIKKIVIGYPLNFKGGKTETSNQIDIFIRDTLSKFKLEVIKVEEAGSTKQANKLINNFGNAKIEEDSISATIILNKYLNESN